MDNNINLLQMTLAIAFNLSLDQVGRFCFFFSAMLDSNSNRIGVIQGLHIQLTQILLDKLNLLEELFSDQSSSDPNPIVLLHAQSVTRMTNHSEDMNLLMVGSPQGLLHYSWTLHPLLPLHISGFLLKVSPLLPSPRRPYSSDAQLWSTSFFFSSVQQLGAHIP